MPFLRAGFNPRNHLTGIRGWTRPAERPDAFAVAELRVFACGDYFWYGLHPRHGRFLVWGEQAVIGSHWGFELPWEYQNGLAHSVVDTREEVPAWRWLEERRARLACGEVLDG